MKARLLKFLRFGLSLEAYMMTFSIGAVVGMLIEAFLLLPALAG